MKVMCVQGSQGILNEGDIYTVIHVTKSGNFILKEVDPPKGYGCFDYRRFIPIQDQDDNWTEELEEQFWAENPPAEYNA